MSFGCSKEPSHPNGSFEYPQHMFWLRNKKNNFLLHTLIWEPALGLELGIISNFRYTCILVIEHNACPPKISSRSTLSNSNLCHHPLASRISQLKRFIQSSQKPHGEDAFGVLARGSELDASGLALSVPLNDWLFCKSDSPDFLKKTTVVP